MLTEIRREEVPLTTSAGGAATGVSHPIRGRLERMTLVGGLDAGGTITVTKTATSEVVATGTVADFSAGGDLQVDAMVMSGETLTVTVSAGGNQLSGTLYVYLS